jgi:hypothetical protein
LFSIEDRSVRDHSLLVGLGQQGLQAFGQLGPQVRVLHPLSRTHEHQNQFENLTKVFALKQNQIKLITMVRK